MKCPACGHDLKEKKVSPQLTVDVCEGGCGGIWFDNYELAKLDEKREALGDALLHIPRNASPPAGAQRRSCPRCSGIKMMRHPYALGVKIEIDRCGNCNGIWLDAGELAAIRNQCKSESEREQAAVDLAAKVIKKFEGKQS
jgi:uncharacterized protein